jgi:hypothetical protein
MRAAGNGSFPRTAGSLARRLPAETALSAVIRRRLPWLGGLGNGRGWAAPAALRPSGGTGPREGAIGPRRRSRRSFRRAALRRAGDAARGCWRPRQIPLPGHDAPAARRSRQLRPGTRRRPAQQRQQRPQPHAATGARRPDRGCSPGRAHSDQCSGSRLQATCPPARKSKRGRGKQRLIALSGQRRVKVESWFRFLNEIFMKLEFLTRSESARGGERRNCG